MSEIELLLSECLPKTNEYKLLILFDNNELGSYDKRLLFMLFGKIQREYKENIYKLYTAKSKFDAHLVFLLYLMKYDVTIHENITNNEIFNFYHEQHDKEYYKSLELKITFEISKFDHNLLFQKCTGFPNEWTIFIQFSLTRNVLGNRYLFQYFPVYEKYLQLRKNNRYIDKVLNMNENNTKWNLYIESAMTINGFPLYVRFMKLKHWPVSLIKQMNKKDISKR